MTTTSARSAPRNGESRTDFAAYSERAEQLGQQFPPAAMICRVHRLELMREALRPR